MSRRISSSGTKVLRWFLDGNSSWTHKGGFPIYETRGLTAMVCQRLARDGYLVESFTSDGSVFTLNCSNPSEMRELSRSL